MAACLLAPGGLRSWIVAVLRLFWCGLGERVATRSKSTSAMRNMFATQTKPE